MTSSKNTPGVNTDFTKAVNSSAALDDMLQELEAAVPNQQDAVRTSLELILKIDRRHANLLFAGPARSGKTQLALRLGEWFGTNGDVARLLTVAVRPDWVGPEALFGYRDALRPTRNGRDAWFVPAPLSFLLDARKDPGMPYLMVLDEMNLAHVERYFSDFLSGVESRRPVLTIHS